MRTLLAALLLAAASGAAGEVRLPTLFGVAGVSAGDVLNIRAAPDPTAEIVGSLAPDAQAVEVVGLDPSGTWGQVNTGERAGWVAMRFLAPRDDVWREGSLPEHLACFGTEPFWSLRPGGGTVVFSTPDAPDRALELTAALAPGLAELPQRALIAEGAGGRLTASITPAACTDGMSDRAYGLGVMLVRERGGAADLLTGCCSVAP